MDEFRALAEAKLNEADGGNPNYAPFGYDHAESTAYLSGKASALQWALEMLADVTP